MVSVGVPEVTAGKDGGYQSFTPEPFSCVDEYATPIKREARHLSKGQQKRCLSLAESHLAIYHLDPILFP